ncbi:hypothetical protein OTU49_002691 [Cherax quadricarinatus]|uniref:Potassium channel inwardly rectifying transmembrane domain-containing protein n=1 Tax=Cherax quadricarinatus TaxID=27406 RepID=A0AAW0X8W3_CHEQU
MKVSGGEAAGPVLPVWQTLKGLSSRDVQCSSPTSPGYQQQQQQQQQQSVHGSNMAAERLARRDSCPLDAPSSSSFPYPGRNPPLPQLLIPEGDRSPGLLNGSVAPPLSAPPIVSTGEGPARPLWGPPSSSTTSTSLSNTNLALHNNNNNNNHVVSNNNVSYATSPKEEEEDVETPSVFSFLTGLPYQFMIDLYRHTRISSKKMRKRVVQKNGECNVSPSNVAKRRRRYLQDIFTTLVDIQVDAVCGERVQFHFVFPVQRGDSAYYRLRVPSHHRTVSRGHLCYVSAEHHGCHDTGLHGWHRVRQTLSSQEAHANTLILSQRVSLSP